MRKGFAVLLVLIVIVLAGLLTFSFFKFSTLRKSKPSQTPSINSFEDCATAGNPILETYPRQCKTPDGKSFTEITQPTSSPTITPSATSQSSTDETADWKTYTKDKFSIKLPPSFVETIDEYVNSPKRRMKYYFFSSPNYRSNKYDGECPIVNKNSLGIAINLNNLSTSLNTLDKIREVMRPKYSTYSEEEIALDGEPGGRFLAEFNQCGYKDVLGINDDIYTINKLGIPLTIKGIYFKGDEKNKHIFDQILSTFKFLD